MNTTSSRLFDSAFRAEWCNGDAAWNIDFLHLLGHPVSAADWHWAEELRDAGISPEEAVVAYRRDHHEFQQFTYHDDLGLAS